MEDIFRELNKRGVCPSRHEFQRSWLGVNVNYFAMVKNRGATVSMPVLVKLYALLLDRYHPDLAERVRLEMLAIVRRPSPTTKETNDDLQQPHVAAQGTQVYLRRFP
jgi:hypothetical protein